MLRFYLHLTVIPFLLLTTALLLIHAQPYDDHDLRQLLLPDGCPAPCFMGIRPGVTTVEEAIKILEASGWVDNYERDPILPVIRITWNRNRPSWLENDALYNGSVIWIDDDLVTAFMLDTTLRLGELQWIFGRAVYQHVEMDYLEASSYLFYSAYYPQIGLSTIVWGDCSGKRKYITYRDIVYLGYSDLTNQSDFLRSHLNIPVQ
jgi:hypothetical protein